MRAVSVRTSCWFLPSSSSTVRARLPAYSSASTARQHGAGQRLIWYSMQGRTRLRNTVSLQLRSGKILRMVSRVSRTDHAEENGPK